jgi:hypothetical protein
MSQPSERLLARMDEFVATIGATLSVPQRRRFAEYARGLLLPGERKSMKRLAARLDPEHAMARYKTFQRFVSVSSWDDQAVRHAGFRFAERAPLRGKPPLAWLVDDTGMFPASVTLTELVFLGQVQKRDRLVAAVLDHRRRARAAHREPRRRVRLRDGGAAPVRRHPACSLSAGAVLAGGARPPPRTVQPAHTAAVPLPPSHLKSPSPKKLGRRAVVHVGKPRPSRRAHRPAAGH